ncbi:MAG: NUDIX domain-containing protein [Candidatus Shapirobacteria bacterium]|nr:NUDIX domain-containing protein [Candidatus Shapirobacteria bacterium]
MELIKVLDENGQETGQILDKEIIHQKGLWHREVAVWIFNSKGEILVQRRAASKKMNPNQIGLCAGHVPENEDSITAMIREISEELGIEVNQKSLNFLITEKKERSFPNSLINRIFNKVYYLKIDKEITDFKIQEEELSEIFWINYLEFKEKIQNKDPEIGIQTDFKTLDLLDKIYSKITQ